MSKCTSPIGLAESRNFLATARLTIFSVASRCAFRPEPSALCADRSCRRGRGMRSRASRPALSAKADEQRRYPEFEANPSGKSQAIARGRKRLGARRIRAFPSPSRARREQLAAFGGADGTRGRVRTPTSCRRPGRRQDRRRTTQLAAARSKIMLAPLQIQFVLVYTHAAWGRDVGLLCWHMLMFLFTIAINQPHVAVLAR